MTKWIIISPLSLTGLSHMSEIQTIREYFIWLSLSWEESYLTHKEIKYHSFFLFFFWLSTRKYHSLHRPNDMREKTPSGRTMLRLWCLFFQKETSLIPPVFSFFLFLGRWVMSLKTINWVATHVHKNFFFFFSFPFSFDKSSEIFS